MKNNHLTIILLITLFVGCKKNGSDTNSPIFKANINNAVWTADSVGATETTANNSSEIKIIAKGQDGNYIIVLSSSFVLQQQSATSSTSKSTAVSSASSTINAFSVSFNGTNAVILSWDIGNDLNKSYIVERSYDAQNFAPIDTIAAINAGDETYSYSDIRPPLTTILNTVVYYRLEMIDAGGAVSYSQTKVVAISGNSLFLENMGKYSFGYNNSFNISDFSSNKINGTFSFTYLDPVSNQQVQVSNGIFENLPIKQISNK